ncbi:FAD:protein FMN transferase [Halanaerocella petrolearia]
MRKYHKILVLSIIFILLLSAIGCDKRERNIKSSLKSDYMMGTVVKMKVYHSQPDQIIKESFSIIEDLEEKMSSRIRESEINQVNKAAGREKVKVSDDTYQVLKKSLEYARLTKGAFDPTIGPLVELWGIGTKEAKVPKKNKIKTELALVDYNKVKLFPESNEIFLAQADMILDVGGIAKGYAADKIIELWKEKGVKSGFISLGGNVSVLGSKTDGTAWKVGIQDPKQPRGDVMATIKVKDKTVVTSGNYERYFMKDGVRYHHILNPQTGRPARKGIISSTIVTDNSFDADTLSTAIYVLGIKKGLKLIRELSQVEALVITDDQQLYLTPGLKEKVNIIKNKEYKVIN